MILYGHHGHLLFSCTILVHVSCRQKSVQSRKGYTMPLLEGEVGGHSQELGCFCRGSVGHFLYSSNHYYVVHARQQGVDSESQGGS